MKLLLTFIFAIAMLGAVAQQEAPKGSNVVMFTADSLADLALFIKAGQLLKDQGYTLVDVDKDFFTMSTQPEKPKRIQLEYRLDIAVSGNVISIKSYAKSLDNFSSFSGGLGHSTTQTFERGANRSLSTSLWRFAWDKSVEYATAVNEVVKGSISYKED